MENRKAEITFGIAKKWFNGADEDQKAIALATYPELGMNIMERVSNFSDICKIAGVPKEVFIVVENESKISRSMKLAGKIMLISDVLNEGEDLDYTNQSQRKWYPWHKSEDGEFSFYLSVNDCWGTDVSARMCFKSEALSDFAGKTFLQEYRDFKENNR